MSGRTETDLRTGSPGRQIGALEEASRSLAGAAGLKDLLPRFLAVLQDYFAGDEVRIFRDAGSGWEIAAGEWSGAVPRFPLPGDASGTASEIETGTMRVVQNLADRSRIGVVLAAGGEGITYTEQDLVALRLFLMVFDNVYRDTVTRRKEKDLIFSLNHRVLQLNSLIDTGIEISKLSGTALPHHLALERAASLTNASRGVLRVSREGRSTEEVWFPHGGATGEEIAPPRRIASAFEFGGESYTFFLFDKESRSGVIPFDETDQLLLDALTRQVHASLENRFLHHEALEKQKIEQDIEIAVSIQQRILPKSLPQMDGYDIAGINIPSKSVGGDYYDCIPLPGGRFAMVIADVAGKGVPAALLVSSFHAFLAANLESPIPLVDLAVRLNRLVAKTSTEDKFITAFFAVLHAASGELETVNAGHNPVFLRHQDGTIQELSLGGIPLGMLDIDFPYQSETLIIGKGERLLLYTDGIPEATDAGDRLYETDFPLREFVSGHVPENAKTFINDLIADVRKFTGAAPQSDDITALYLVKQ